MPSERKYRAQIIEFGRMLHDRGYVAAMDGNLSVRLDEDRILATPTAMCKGMMRASDLVIVDMAGNLLEGRRNVSSEIGMHLLIYRLRPDIHGVVHAHPPTATGFAAAGMALNKPLVCEVVIGLGSIPLAEYGTPGTPELAAALEPLVPQYDAILMANHGVVTYADDLHHAYMKLETVEHFAQIALVTHMLGKQQPLAGLNLQKLMDIRGKYEGSRSAAPLPLDESSLSVMRSDGKRSSSNARQRQSISGHREATLRRS
ncbi:MAG TPA: class II aldolase/adducin family protein [Terriglobales bacterium]|jgi:L-fuculose-phosphate aldolase